MPIAEYIWIDAKGRTRSKARTLKESEYRVEFVNSFPEWNYDGSSTGQASGDNSEVIIKPVAVFRDPFRKLDEDLLVLCDTYDSKDVPLPTNHRSPADVSVFEMVLEEKPWFGLEQEYTLFSLETELPLGWPSKGNPKPQGPYYCGVGADRIYGREIVNQHYRACLDAGVKISGVNGEVMPGQWEFQIGPCEGIQAGDHMTVARYLLHRICEQHGCIASFDPKPMKGDWNGSGCHTNFSTKSMRVGETGRKAISEAIDKLQDAHMEHISVYGSNDERLSGKHETSKKEEFRWGVADRGASIRIPRHVDAQGYGYIEDRRPASDCCPYEVTAIIAKTVLLD